MWKIKMEALLITQGLGEAIDPVTKIEGGEASSSKTPEQVVEMDKKARSTIILSLGDSVIREVAKERTVAGLWAKLENLYMTKSLANRLYIKKKMFSLKMIEGASLTEHVDEFNKVCDELETIDEGLSDESKALLLISSLPKSYEHFVDALLYGRQTLSLEEVKSALGTKKLKDKQDNPESESSEGLMARGRPEKRDNKGKNLMMFDGVIRELTQVRFVPDLKRNLISIGMLDQTGCIIKAEKGVLRVIKGSMVIMKGIKQNGLYVMDGHTAVGEASVTDSKLNRSMLWHLRMGHMSERGLRELQKQGVFGGDQIGALGFCEDCILGKFSRLRFETAVHTTKDKLEYIHSDLWGSAQVNSLGGCRYFLTFIDDFSRMVWVFALKSKDEVLEKFKNWKTFVENQTGLKVKTLRTDNGLEYCNKLFEEFCEKNGIQRHKIITYTPQQNGLAEKMNRTLVEKGKLEPRALKCRFLGYPEGVKGYRLWCVDSKPPQCIISRDVRFHEEELLNKPRNPDNNIESGTETDMVKFQVEPQNLKEPEPETEGAEAEPEAGIEHESAESEEDTYQLARDRKKRTIRPPKRYAVADLIAYALNAAQELNDDEPRTYQEAITSKNKLEWKRAMDEEMTSLIKNKTWTLIEKPDKRKTVSCKWIFKIKDGIPGAEPRRFKARLVARGFTQNEGIDFTEVFSPVVRHVSIRVILALVAVQDMHLEQMDVKTAFLHGELQEEIVMQQPEGYVASGKEDYVYLLKKSLYGLKQSPRQWYLKFDNFMITHAFNRCSYDCCVYFKETSEGGMIYLLLYVDDMLIACHDMEEIDHLKKLLSREFEMKELGEAKRILGMDIIRNRSKKRLFLTQQNYIQMVLVKFGMDEAKQVQTPLASHFKLSAAQCPQTEAEQQRMACIPYSSAVGSLRYAMVLTRPDISHAVSMVSRFMANSGYEHWRAVQWIMRYLKGTLEVGLVYDGENKKGHTLIGYVDADFAGDLDKRRSQTGYLFTMGGCTVSWKATLQNVVALSTTEAEYTAAAEALKEAIWLKSMTTELGAKQESVTVYSDSQSAIHLSKNQSHHERTKHIDVKLHFVRLEVSRGAVKLLKIHTEENPTDMLTKVVPTAKFILCMNLAGICRV
ncbi:hypothetical protein KPL70_023479 [Citrus sinensis]|nr:hypothetical protein KPL70_023479 [Citrus sinensis]